MDDKTLSGSTQQWKDLPLPPSRLPVCARNSITQPRETTTPAVSRHPLPSTRCTRVSKEEPVSSPLLCSPVTETLNRHV